MDKVYAKPNVSLAVTSLSARLLVTSSGNVSLNVRENPSKGEHTDPGAEGIGVGKEPVPSFDF